jgi:hypothetical protein
LSAPPSASTEAWDVAASTFLPGDEHGYNLGQRVGGNVLARTMGYVTGTIAGTNPGAAALGTTSD